ncbi:heme peroxidase [Mycena capillaripes]|nr:heme peroxidase [Mycena capillaripes]
MTFKNAEDLLSLPQPGTTQMILLTVLTWLVAVNAYVWPSPKLDALDAARFDQAGFRAHGIAPFITPCSLFVFGPPNTTGRTDAADWIRAVRLPRYGDAQRHGRHRGLDASIRFAEEQARPENAGDGFSNTLAVLLPQANRYVSIADALAIGAIIAIENCGGPEIEFRGGRIDAGEPNAPGVPEPQQDLAAHIASFSRQGFTQTEMIGLVACGHSFGGVQHAPFPDIVDELNDPTNTESVAHFDSTFFTFDNNVATEYISGSTQNPLLVGFNDTTNSDKRIFGSDANATMRSFAESPELFASTCADLFARMLNTVPSGVKLADVITPLPVKPVDLELVLNNNTIQLSWQLRVWNMTADASHTVNVLWDDHVGGTGNNASMNFLGVSTAAGRHSASWFGLPSGAISLDPAAGITSMRFVVDGTLEDQGGLGFPVQDGFMLSSTSCITSINATTDSPAAARVDVAVRNGVSPTRVYVEQVAKDSVQRPIIIEIDLAPAAQPVAATSAYSLWSATVTGVSLTSLFTLGAEIEGVKYSTNLQRSVTQFLLCP